MIKTISERGFHVTKNGEVYINNKRRKLRCGKRRYYTFNVRINNTTMPILVHRLQAYQKYGDKIFEPGIVVRHLDGNSLNNNWDNIAIGTQQDNMLDIPKEKRMKKALYATSFVIKYDHREVYTYYCQTKSYKKTMAKFHIGSKGTLAYIIRKFKQ